jgi:two-component system, NarL family, sensor histidine kinase DesK
MLNWYRINRVGAAGVLASLLFGGIEVMTFLLAGAMRADLNTPVGVLAELLASQLTPAPSEFRAGSDRRMLTYTLVVYTQVAVTLLFAALLWLRTRMPRQTAAGNVLLALQTTLGVATMSSMLYLLAAELTIVLPTRKGLAWLAAQIVLLAAVFVWLTVFYTLRFTDDSVRSIWIFGAMGLMFQAIAYGITWLAVRERRTRIALAAANAHLLATQSMLADTVRSSERLRIARDLHDAVGHHLTALNLHLDLAVRQSAPSAPQSLQTSRELAGNLLAEVRSVVSAERKERIDLRSALTTLCKGIPAPRIALSIAPEVEVDSPVLAHTLFFCVQEALTNAVRHAGATHLAINLASTAGVISLAIEDDGAGVRGAIEGNGLRGMRERIAELGGSMALDANRKHGCRIEIAVPLDGGAT